MSALKCSDTLIALDSHEIVIVTEVLPADRYRVLGLDGKQRVLKHDQLKRRGFE